MANITISLGNGIFLSAPATDDMLKEATGLTASQISMLSAIFLGLFNVDASSLSAKEMVELAGTKSDQWLKR